MPAHDSAQTPEPNVQKLNSLLQGARIGMMTSLDKDGQLCSRPMTMQELDPGGYLWFFTGLHAHVVEELEQDSRINVSVVHGSTYVSIAGRGAVLKDPGKQAELWNPAYKAWFSGGLEDPELRLIKVTIERADYWDTPGGVVSTVFGLVKSMATGEAAHDVGEHGHLGVTHR